MKIDDILKKEDTVARIESLLSDWKEYAKEAAEKNAPKLYDFLLEKQKAGTICLLDDKNGGYRTLSVQEKIEGHETYNLIYILGLYTSVLGYLKKGCKPVIQSEEKGERKREPLDLSEFFSLV